jgi:hypothetical protein
MARESGRVPPALLRKPDLFFDVEEIWLAFWKLNRSRPSGFGPGAIPFSDIVAYLTVFPHVDPRFFIHAIQEMDLVLLEHHADQIKAENKSGGKKVPRRPRRK